MDEIFDVQILIKTPTCLLSKYRDLKVNILDIRGTRKSISHLVEVERNLYSSLLNIAKDNGLDVSGNTFMGETCIARILSRGCLVCKTLVDKGAFLISGRLLTDSVMTYRFIITNKILFDRILESLGRAGIKYEVLSIKRLKKKKYLTPKQEQVLILSLKLGLFDHPRRIKLYEAANMLGIKPSTFAEILKRGIKKVLEDALY